MIRAISPFKIFLAISTILHLLLLLVSRLVVIERNDRIPLIEVTISPTTQEGNRKQNIPTIKQPAEQITTGENTVTSDTIAELNRILQNRIRYPARAAAMGWQGVVRVRVVINDEGGIARLIFTEKDEHEDFNHAVTDALESWKFNYPQGSEIPLTFRFILRE